MSGRLTVHWAGRISGGWRPIHLFTCKFRDLAVISFLSSEEAANFADYESIMFNNHVLRLKPMFLFDKLSWNRSWVRDSRETSLIVCDMTLTSPKDKLFSGWNQRSLDIYHRLGAQTERSPAVISREEGNRFRVVFLLLPTSWVMSTSSLYVISPFSLFFYFFFLPESFFPLP